MVLISRIRSLKELQELARAVVPRQVGALGLDDVAHVAPHGSSPGLNTVANTPRSGSVPGRDTATNAPRRQIQVLMMGYVSDAPIFVDIIREKAVAVGWVCNELPFIEKTAKFAMILAKLRDEIVPKLKRNPADKATLRLLHARRIRTKRRRVVEGTVIASLAASLSNRVNKLARVVLSKQRGPAWLAERLDDLAAHVESCLNTPVPVYTGDDE